MNIDEIKDFLKHKYPNYKGVIEHTLVAEMAKTYAEHYHALQLQQTGVNGSFFKCTCLHPKSNCFSGKCSYCNRTIQKDITTDDLQNCR